jgi:hypothetical protein
MSSAARAVTLAPEKRAKLWAWLVAEGVSKRR